MRFLLPSMRFVLPIVFAAFMATGARAQPLVTPDWLSPEAWATRIPWFSI